MKFYLLKGDVPTNIQEHFQAVELTEEELKLIELFTGTLDIASSVYKELYPWLNNINRLKAHAKIRKILVNEKD